MPPSFPNSPGGTFLSHLSVAGSLNLGSAALTIDLANACVATGLVLDVAGSAPNALSGTFTRPSTGGPLSVPNGAVIPAINAPRSASGTTSYLRINYNYPGGLVTATAVAAPKIAVTTSHSPTVPGSPVTYTATVSPAPSPADGTVSFLDNGVAISGCTARPVSTGDGVATCTTSYAAPGNHVITASYSGSPSLPPAGPSPAITQVVVPAPHRGDHQPVGPVVRRDTDPGHRVGRRRTRALRRGAVLPEPHRRTVGRGAGDVPNCGPGQTSSSWSFTPPPGSIPGIYQFVAQAYDVAFNAGPASNVIFQIIMTDDRTGRQSPRRALAVAFAGASSARSGHHGGSNTSRSSPASTPSA